MNDIEIAQVLQAIAQLAQKIARLNNSIARLEGSVANLENDVADFRHNRRFIATDVVHLNEMTNRHNIIHGVTTINGTTYQLPHRRLPALGLLSKHDNNIYEIHCELP